MRDVPLAAPAAAQQFTFKISSPVINDSTQEYMKALKAALEQRSGGKIKVEMYPANQLGQIPTTVEGVALGTIEMTTPAIGFYIGIEPRFLGELVEADEAAATSVSSVAGGRGSGLKPRKVRCDSKSARVSLHGPTGGTSAAP